MESPNTGMVSNASPTTLRDGSKNWVVNSWAGYAVSIIEGFGAGQTVLIGSNNQTTLTLTSPFATVPNFQSVYIITQLASTSTAVLTPKGLISVTSSQSTATDIESGTWTTSANTNFTMTVKGNVVVFVVGSGSIQGYGDTLKLFLDSTEIEAGATAGNPATTGFIILYGGLASVSAGVHTLYMTSSGNQSAQTLTYYIFQSILPIIGKAKAYTASGNVGATFTYGSGSLSVPYPTVSSLTPSYTIYDYMEGSVSAQAYSFNVTDNSGNPLVQITTPSDTPTVDVLYSAQYVTTASFPDVLTGVSVSSPASSRASTQFGFIVLALLSQVVQSP